MAAGKKPAKKSRGKLPAKGKHLPANAMADHDIPPGFPVLPGGIRDLVKTARSRVAVGVNGTLLLMNRGIGSGIHKECLKKD